jgi:CubicO group peptidase (beta-lactamase class C family)
MVRTVLGAAAAWLVLGWGSTRAAEGPRLPETPAGKQLAAWLGAYNSGEVEAVRQFVREHYAGGRPGAEARRLQAFNMIYADNGPLRLVKVEKSGPEEVVALARSPLTEDHVRLTARVEPKPPHRIVQVAIDLADEPEDAAAHGRLTDAQIAARLQEYVDRLAAADRFSGTVLVAHDGKPIFTAARGLASRAFGVPNRLDTRFNLGSMNKMFTAVAVAQLAQQGKLSFDDPLIKHLPDYPDKEVARKVTLHHLLTHTSGLGNYFTDKYRETSKDRFRAVADYFPLFVGKPLEFEPGARFSYSNTGFMVLGAVIEKVSGQDYFEYVREHVYRPVGMVGTDAYEMDHDTPNLAIGYTSEVPESGKLGSRKKNNLFLHVVKGGPAGGGFSTVEDLLRFATALTGHKLLDEKHTETVLSGKVKTGRGDGDAMYGYGFFVETDHGTRVVGHGGGFPGINSDLAILRDRGYVVAVMSNYDPPTAQRVAAKARRLILQQ